MIQQRPVILQGKHQRRPTINNFLSRFLLQMSMRRDEQTKTRSWITENSVLESCACIFSRLQFQVLWTKPLSIHSVANVIRASSVAARAKEVGVDAAGAPVLSELDGIFHWKQKQWTHWRLLWGNVLISPLVAFGTKLWCIAAHQEGAMHS